METDQIASDATRVAGRPRRPARIHGARVGVLAGADASAGVTVTFSGALGTAPVAARSTVALSPADVGREVVLLFDEGDPARPLVTGVLQPAPVAPPSVQPARVTGRLRGEGVPGVTSDGREMVIEAERELVLRCGKSSVVLRADGEIQIRGVRITSRARATNKVRGATVQIN